MLPVLEADDFITPAGAAATKTARWPCDGVTFDTAAAHSHISMVPRATFRCDREAGRATHRSLQRRGYKRSFSGNTVSKSGNSLPVAGMSVRPDLRSCRSASGGAPCYPCDRIVIVCGEGLKTRDSRGRSRQNRSERPLVRFRRNNAWPSTGPNGQFRGQDLWALLNSVGQFFSDQRNVH